MSAIFEWSSALIHTRPIALNKEFLGGTESVSINWFYFSKFYVDCSTEKQVVGCSKNKTQLRETFFRIIICYAQCQDCIPFIPISHCCIIPFVNSITARQSIPPQTLLTLIIFSSHKSTNTHQHRPKHFSSQKHTWHIRKKVLWKYSNTGCRSICNKLWCICFVLY